MDQSNKHTYHLPKTGRKWCCPGCGKKSWKPYVDEYERPFDEGFKDADPKIQEEAKKVGRCDRQDNCNYHYPPAEFFKNMKIGIPDRPKDWTPPPKKEQLPAWKWSDVEKSMCVHRTMAQQPTLIQYWLKVAKLPPLLMKDVLERYYIGTTRSNGIIYWMIDEHGQARDGKIMTYKADGHRDKERPPQWVWKNLFRADATKDGHFDKDAYDALVRDMETKYDTRKPYFGTHLLKDPRFDGWDVGLVEGEKSALICSMLVPAKIIWLAMGTNTPNEERINTAIYQHRRMHLFPDIDQVDKIPQKVAQFSSSLKKLITVEYEWIKAHARTEKDDIGDILLRDWMENQRDRRTVANEVEASGTEANESETAELSRTEQEPNTAVDDVPIVSPWRLAEYALGIPDGALMPFEDGFEIRL